MEAHDQELPLVHDITSEEPTKQPSLADQLRARRSEIADSKEVFLPIIGYEEYGVVAKHRLMERVEIELIGKKVLAEVRERGERNMRILLDTIINSTMGFYLKPNEETDPQEIQDDRHDDRTVLNWGEFARYLGWEPNGEGDARSALYWVFAGNDFAVGQYGVMLNRWMGNTGIKVDEEFLGEVL
jgi:hypothetical protein